jgi:hypothetical protein
MKVEFLTQIVGKGFSYLPGDVRSLPNDVAKDFINAGYAKIVAEAPGKRAERAVVGKRKNKK